MYTTLLYKKILKNLHTNLDKVNNYEDDEKSDNKNLNQYDEIFEKAHKYVTIRNRIENINQELLKNIDEPNIKEKILRVEEIIYERRKV